VAPDNFAQGAFLIPTWPGTLAAFALVAVFFTCLGLPLARKAAFPGVPPLSLAPAFGWATYNVIALPTLSVTGFSTLAVSLYSLAAASLAALAWRPPRRAPSPSMPLWALAIAATMGMLPLAAILPKFVPGGVLLAPPMFDHVKIALVDAILRDGLPVPNPFYGPRDPGHLAYYYLWHFGTAVVARLPHVGGWQAEAAMTGFTAFSSSLLMAGLAIALGGRAFAIIATAVLSLAGSLRPILIAAVGERGANALIPGNSDIGNWLNQAAWVPQHMASATCVVLSALLMSRMADGGWWLAALLSLTVAAGFQSSIWVGGIAFTAVGFALGVWLLWRTPTDWLRVLLRLSGAACLTSLLVAPFVMAELRGLATRGGGAGIAVAPYQVLGSVAGPPWRALLDVPAFWLLLPFAFPALAPLGAACLLQPEVLKTDPARRPLAATLCITALACLVIAWLFRSTLDNNDLGWRAVLPALLVAAPASGCLAERLMARRPLAILPFALIAALGLPQTVIFAGDYLRGQRPGDPAGFARAEPLWQAVRRIAAPDERIASNPLAVAAATPWPVNIAWAVLADRPSCYAGWETVLAYGGVSRATLETLDARFTRVFAGRPNGADMEAIATLANCRIAVVTPADGAWAADPFSTSPLYRLVTQSPAWRIYRQAGISQTAPAGAAAASAPPATPSVPATHPDRPSSPAP